MQAESINGLKNVYGLQLALHLPEGSYYELCKHETHVVSVKSHVYSISICNENDYKTFWTHLCN